MTEQRIHFLSGLPRTGSTLLGSILNQNPETYCSPTSPLYPLLFDTNESLNRLALQHTFDPTDVGNKIYPSMVQAFYPDGREKPIVFDKHRGWPNNIEAIKQFVDPNPKIVATIRPIAEIITSYIVLADADPSNFIDAHLRREGAESSNEARATLLWSHYLKAPYESLVMGLKTHPGAILLVSYDKLCYNPQGVFDGIYEFCELPSYEHNFDTIENTCEEAKDEAWGLKNLHAIRPTLGKVSVNPLAVLPQEAISYFKQFDLEISNG